MDTTYISQEGYDELIKELNNLRGTGRKGIAERLKHAKELGDLSENSEYQEAREDQTRLEQRISQMEEAVRQTVLIKKTTGSATVRIGSQIKVKKNGDIIHLSIVGSHETDPIKGRISNESPLARSLLGKKVGDEVEVKAPKGSITYKIIEIE
ncbi:MAG: transcription elongation factor GreA [Patescibacteria group bacterium]